MLDRRAMSIGRVASCMTLQDGLTYHPLTGRSHARHDAMVFGEEVFGSQGGLLSLVQATYWQLPRLIGAHERCFHGTYVSLDYPVNSPGIVRLMATVDNAAD